MTAVPPLSATPAPAAPWRIHAALAVLIGALTLLVYGPVLGGYFLSDDFVILSWTRVGSLDGLIGLFDPRAVWFYRPLLKVVYWASQSVFGLNPLPLHIFILAMHALAAWLIYYYAATVARAGSLVAGAAALLFLVQHRHVEPLASISAMGELIAVPALLGALWAAHRFAARPTLPGWLGTVGLFAVGLLGRESPVVLPVLVAAGLLLFGPRPTLRVGAMLGAGYAAVLAGYALLQLQVADRGGAEGAVLARGGLQYKALNAESVVLGIMDYVNGLLPGGARLAAWPLEQLRPVAWLELVALAALALGLARLRGRLALFGLIWLVVSPLPFVFFNAPTDRYFYMPTIGYSLLVVGLLSSLAAALARRLSRPPLPLQAALLAGAVLLGWGSQWPGIVANRAHWNAAAATSAAVLDGVRAAVPAPGPGATFLFVDLPTEWEGVPMFRNGLTEAVQLLYGDDRSLRAGIVACKEVQGGVPAPPTHVLQFAERNVRLLTTPPSCP